MAGKTGTLSKFMVNILDCCVSTLQLYDCVLTLYVYVNLEIQTVLLALDDF